MKQQDNKTNEPLVIRQFISNCIAVRIKIATMDCIEFRVFDDQYNAASVIGIDFNSLLRMLNMLLDALQYKKNQAFDFLNKEKTMVVALGWHQELDAYSLLIDKYAAHIYSNDIVETVDLLNSLIQRLENISWGG